MKRITLLVCLFSCFLFAVAQQNNINLVFIGNSITAGATLKNPKEQAPPILCGQMVQEVMRLPVHVFNGGHSGITTFGFLPGRADFEKVCNAATSMLKEHDGVLYFSIMLGTNDSACTRTEGAPVSVDTYEANMRSIIEELLRRFPACRIIVNYPIWYSPNTYNSAKYLQEGLNRLHSYYPVIDRIVKSDKRVYAGIRKSWNQFENNTELFTPENGNAGVFHLHPNVQGATHLAGLWTKSVLKVCKADGIKRNKVQNKK